MRRALVALAALAAGGCELADCEEGAVSMGGVCFPEDVAAASAPPAVCGNGICEHRPRPAESVSSCPADCDPGPGTRATLLWYLSTRFYNAHVAGVAWPAGRVDARGSCDRGDGSASGVIGSAGGAVSFSLSYGFTGCGTSLATVGTITADGQGMSLDGTFDNAAKTSSYRFRGTLSLAGTDGSAPYGPSSCPMDFTRVTTATVTIHDGQLCGQTLRRVVTDD